MQAIKEKLSDMSEMRKAKAEAKEEEKAEKELAKARVEVAHEVRLAREAEAAMDLHVNKAAEKVARHEEKHSPHMNTDQQYGGGSETRTGTGTENPYGHNSSNVGYSSNQAAGGGVQDLNDSNMSHIAPNLTTGTGYASAPPANKYM